MDPAEGDGSDIVSSIESISCGSEGWGIALRINEVQQTVRLHDQMIEQALADLQEFMRKP